jgi:hypothetical protein
MLEGHLTIDCSQKAKWAFSRKAYWNRCETSAVSISGLHSARYVPFLQHKACRLQCKNKLNEEPEAKNLKCSCSVFADACMHSLICGNHRNTDTIWAVEWMDVIWSSLPTHIKLSSLSLVSASFPFWSLTVTEQQSLKTAPWCYGHTVFASTEKTQNILTPNSETVAKYKAYLVEYDQHILYNMNERCP